MKLLTKSSIYFIVTSLIIFLISGVAIYFMLQMVILCEVDDLLIDKKEDMLWELHQSKGFENFTIPKDSSIIIEPAKGKKISQSIFRDTLILDMEEYEFIPFRYIQFQTSYNGENRRVTIYQSMIESDDLIEAIIYSLSIIFIITLLAIIVLNYCGMRNLWLPFQKILHAKVLAKQFLG